MISEQSASSRSEVQFGSPSEWVTVREIDLEYRAPEGSPESVLLVDSQHHAQQHACYTRIVRRLETMAAVQQGAQWRCDYDPKTQRVVIHSLAVCRGDQRIEQGDATRARVLQREENLERFVLDGTMTVVVLLADVRPGDVLDVSYTVYTTPRILPEYYSSLAPIPTGGHVRLFSVSVRFPVAQPMTWKTDSAKIQLQERNVSEEEREWGWQVERFSPREPEPQMPPWFFQGRIIQFSNVPDWGVISRGFCDAWAEDFDSPAVLDAMQQISAESNLEQRVEAALRFVQDDIRYLSVNTELGGHVPSNPGEVLTRRFGDCKDKAFLLAHLLRRLGVSARPVLVNAIIAGKVREFLPTTGAFNHAIVEYELGGERYWVDATIAMQGGGPKGRYLPAFDAGLPVGLDVQALDDLPAEQGVERQYRLREFLRIESGDTLLLTVVTVTTGSYADDLRYRAAREGTVAASRQREERYQAIFSAAKRHSDPVIRDDRERNEYAIAESYLVPAGVVSTREPGVSGFQFPVHLMQAFLAFPDKDTRKYPLALPYPCSVEQWIECDFRVLSARGTEVVKFGGRQFQLNLKVNSRPASYVWAYDYASSADHVPVEDYPKHRKAVHEAWEGLVLTILVPTGSKSIGPRRSLEDLLPARAQKAAQPSATESAVSAATKIAPALMSRPARKERPRPPSRRSADDALPRPRRAVLQTSPTAAHRARNISIAIGLILLILRFVFNILQMK